MQRWFVALLAAQALLSQSTDVPSLSRKAAIAEAMSAHPAAIAAAERVGVSQGFRTQAGFGHNPRFYFQHENLRGYGGRPLGYWALTDTFFYLQQTLETAGKRGSRVDLASQDVRLTELERDLVRKQIAGRVSLAYWAAAGAQRRVELYGEALDNLSRMVEYHEIRVREGAIAEADLIRVRLEQQRMKIGVNQARLEAERARIQLQREIGRRDFPHIRLSDRIDQPGSATLADFDRALEQRAEMRVARAGLDRARSDERLQTANAKPNVDVLFGYKRTNGLNTTLGGVQVDLPFWNKNQGNLAAARAGQRVAEANLAATEALIRAEVEAARSEHEIRASEVGQLLEPLREQAGETYRIADSAYRVGGTDLLRLLDAQRVRIEAEIAYAEGLAALRRSEAVLETAMGVEP
ncbi:MAG: TolC family protein [Bryobacteraceae bacterium]